MNCKGQKCFIKFIIPINYNSNHILSYKFYIIGFKQFMLIKLVRV